MKEFLLRVVTLASVLIVLALIACGVMEIARANNSFDIGVYWGLAALIGLSWLVTLILSLVDGIPLTDEKKYKLLNIVRQLKDGEKYASTRTNEYERIFVYEEIIGIIES